MFVSAVTAASLTVEWIAITHNRVVIRDCDGSSVLHAAQPVRVIDPEDMKYLLRGGKLVHPIHLDLLSSGGSESLPGPAGVHKRMDVEDDVIIGCIEPNSVLRHLVNFRDSTRRFFIVRASRQWKGEPSKDVTIDPLIAGHSQLTKRGFGDESVC